MRTFIAFILIFQIFSSQASVSLGGTRVIFDGNKKEASITIYSDEKSDMPYLVQSFIDDYGERGDQIKHNNKIPFIVTPPLFRLEPGNENTLRIIKVSNELPNDRESVYWLNVKAIPGFDKKENLSDGILLISLKNRIKLFYRPNGLNPDDKTFDKVRFVKKDNSLIVFNPTPYFVSFYSLQVGGVNIDTNFMMLPPKNFAHYKIPSNTMLSGEKVVWSYINDYGGKSENIETKLSQGTFNGK